MRDIPESCVFFPAMGMLTVMLLGQQFLCDDDTRWGEGQYVGVCRIQSDRGTEFLRGIVRRKREELWPGPEERGS
jgi:hypothetical protein